MLNNITYILKALFRICVEKRKSRKHLFVVAFKIAFPF